MEEQVQKSTAGKGLGIAGLVIGIIGLILCWIPWVGVVPAVVGLILSAIALAMSKGSSARGLIIAAFVISIVATSVAGYLSYKATMLVKEGLENFSIEFQDALEEIDLDELEKQLDELGDAVEEATDEMEEALEEIEEEMEEAAEEVEEEQEE